MKSLTNFINESAMNKNTLYNIIVDFIDEGIVEYKDIVDEFFYWVSWDDKYYFAKEFCNDHDYFDDSFDGNPDEELKTNLDSHIDNIRETFGDKYVFDTIFDYYDSSKLNKFWDDFKVDHYLYEDE